MTSEIVAHSPINVYIAVKFFDQFLPILVNDLLGGLHDPELVLRILGFQLIEQPIGDFLGVNVDVDGVPEPLHESEDDVFCLHNCLIFGLVKWLRRRVSAASNQLGVALSRADQTGNFVRWLFRATPARLCFQSYFVWVCENRLFFVLGG